MNLFYSRMFGLLIKSRLISIVYYICTVKNVRIRPLDFFTFRSEIKDKGVFFLDQALPGHFIEGPRFYNNKARTSVRVGLAQ